MWRQNLEKNLLHGEESWSGVVHRFGERTGCVVWKTGGVGGVLHGRMAVSSETDRQSQRPEIVLCIVTQTRINTSQKDLVPIFFWCGCDGGGCDVMCIGKRGACSNDKCVAAEMSHGLRTFMRGREIHQDMSSWKSNRFLRYFHSPAQDRFPRSLISRSHAKRGYIISQHQPCIPIYQNKQKTPSIPTNPRMPKILHPHPRHHHPHPRHHRRQNNQRRIIPHNR